MNSLRIRAIKVSQDYGAGTEKPFASQFSQDGLVWWTFHRGTTLAECVTKCQELGQCLIENQLIRPTHILWTDKV